MSVVVPAHASAATIGSCLEGLARQTLARERFEAIVVDSGVDGARAMVEDAGFEYLENRGAGPAERRNAGAARARGRYLAFLDSDCVPEPRWLEAGLEALESGAAVVQGMVLPPEGVPDSPFGHRLWVTGPSPRFESANIFYERDAFERAGGFPEHLFSEVGEPFGEDALLGVRVARAGARVEFCGQALVRHVASAPDFGRHLREQWRLRFFPRLLTEAPELRRDMIAGVFLSWRGPLVWSALAALLLRRPLLALPYAVATGRRLPWSEPRRAVRNAPLHVVSDLVATIALVIGSVRHRRAVL